VRYADEEGRPWGTPGAPARVPTLREGVEQKAWLVGRPAEVIETIREIEARYPGLDQCMIHWAEGIPPAEFKEQLRWFARDVMPAFAGAALRGGDPGGVYPHGVVFPSWRPPRDCIFRFSLPRRPAIIPSAVSGGAGQDPH